MTGNNEPTDPQILEIYKLTVEMADRVSQRRANANAFFLTVNTTLVAIAGFFSLHMSFAVCCAGIVVCVSWWFLLKNYRRLNAAKFEVINKIERNHLPVQPFVEEWKLLGQVDNQPSRLNKLRTQFRELGHIEKIVPAVFTLQYICIFCKGIYELS